MACKSTEEKLQEKNLWGLAVACLSLLIMLWFRGAANYFYASDTINSQLIDMRLITVSDYAISGWIPRAVWKKHIEEVPDDNPTMTFMRHLWSVIEEQLHDSTNLSKEMCKIADIEFIFDNANMLRLLEARANALKKAKSDKMNLEMEHY